MVLDGAGKTVDEADAVLARLRHPQAQAAHAFALGQAVAAGARVDGRAVRRRAQARIGDLTSVAAAWIGQRAEAAGGLLVQIATLALPYYPAIPPHAQALQQVQRPFR